MTAATDAAPSGWPALRVDDWTATREALHLWLQIVGKIELASTTLVNSPAWRRLPARVTMAG